VDKKGSKVYKGRGPEWIAREVTVV
jgi:hypothetical protein